MPKISCTKTLHRPTEAAAVTFGSLLISTVPTTGHIFWIRWICKPVEFIYQCLDIEFSKWGKYVTTKRCSVLQKQCFS